MAAQYSVTSFGARGDGKTDDTAALQTAINGTPAGAVLNFGGPNQIYLISSRLVFQPNRTYQGQATLLMSKQAAPHTAIAKFAYNLADSFTINGLTFDANGVGGGLQIAVDGIAANPAKNVQIIHNVFRNTSAVPNGPWDGAIYSPVGMISSQIAQNQITNCAYGIYLTNPNIVTISDNSFQTIHVGDAISLTFTAAPFAYGQGIQILRNSGQHLGRMAIELWPNGGNTAQSSPITGAVISDNTFSDWDAGYSPDMFGISVMAGQQTTIQNNKLVSAVGAMGIEMGSPASSVTQNTVQGFVSGIVLHDSQGSTISGNLLTGQSLDSIEFANSPGSRSGLMIQNNSIINPQSFGIWVNTSDWGGTTISGNVISRVAGAYPNDSYQSFTGIGTTPPNSPVTVSGNSITQSSVTGPGNFSFIGIRVNGGSGANAASNYINNIVLSQLMLPQSWGLFGNSAGSLDGAIVQGNNFNGLFGASGGAGSVAMQSGGNLIYNCLQNGPLSLNP